eukprot:6201866-Pleurochrysis_carterae.AAC.1
MVVIARELRAGQSALRCPRRCSPSPSQGSALRCPPNSGKYRGEMRRTLEEKCRKLMMDTKNRKGEIQAEKALQAIQWPRGHKDRKVMEEEELASRQMISGIMPEWQQVEDTQKKGAVVMMKLWTGELMNWARTHMKIWIEKKNEHKAGVQWRWDNRGKTLEMFTRWRRNVGYGQEGQEGTERGRGKRLKQEKKTRPTGLNIGAGRGTYQEYRE